MCDDCSGEIERLDADLKATRLELEIRIGEIEALGYRVDALEGYP